ncbi:protein spaetzle 3 [Euwallacea similis]|uniref:protein spaetzle 3 n=1 Tax=Euwallacea similis TaxID=1736056 RepID=UPI00344B6296
MALLNFSSPFLATPNPLTNYYQPPQPPTHQLPPYHRAAYSYPPPQKPFLDEDYAHQTVGQQSPNLQQHQQQQIPYQQPLTGRTTPQQQGPTFTRVTDEGSKTKVHAVIDYDYEDEEEPMPPVTPIQGPIYIKNGSVPVVPLYSHPVLNNGSFVQIPILWTALSVALGLELRGEYIRGVPCIKRHQQLFCPTAGNSYPLDRIELFIDENKALMKRMYGEFIVPEFEDEGGSTFTKRSVKHKRSVKPGVPDIHFEPGPEPPFENFDFEKSHKRNTRQNFRNMNFSNSKNDSGRVDACESKLEIVTPYWASNSAGKVRAIVNTQHFEQAIHQEVCTKTSTKRCTNDCGCEQKYKWHRLLAYDPDNDCRGIFMDWFLFPSCCVCRCNP